MLLPNVPSSPLTRSNSSPGITSPLNEARAVEWSGRVEMQMGKQIPGSRFSSNITKVTSP